jgi:hypothetical protein
VNRSLWPSKSRTPDSTASASPSLHPRRRAQRAPRSDAARRQRGRRHRARPGTTRADAAEAGRPGLRGRRTRAPRRFRRRGARRPRARSRTRRTVASREPAQLGDPRPRQPDAEPCPQDLVEIGEPERADAHRRKGGPARARPSGGRNSHSLRRATRILADGLSSRRSANSRTSAAGASPSFAKRPSRAASSGSRPTTSASTVQSEHERVRKQSLGSCRHELA